MLEEKKRKPKTRGNGTGTAYKKGNTWVAQVTIGWKISDDPSKPRYPVKRRKGGFASKRDALNACASLMLSGNDRVRMTMQQVWDAWNKMYEPRIVPSTMAGYKAAYKHFHTLHGTYMDMISADDLQECMDKCKAGKRTHQVMKVIAGLLWGYAVDKNVIDKDVTDNLFTGHGKSIQRDAITKDEVETIRKAIGRERYAEYVYCLCYLGFRPGEMLELKKDQLCFMDNTWFFVAGKKTSAGKDRIVVIPKQIIQYVLDRLWIPGTDLLFPMYEFSRKKKDEQQKLVRFKPMTDNYFRELVFKPMMARLGIAEGKVPYCARHTYSDKLKRAKGSDKAKAQLIGHTDYNFTINQYQSSDLGDYVEVVDSFE